MVTRAPGQRNHLFLQLFDQALLVRRDDIHAPGASRRPIEKQLLRQGLKAVAKSPSPLGEGGPRGKEAGG
jgi:hypothetical protein